MHWSDVDEDRERDTRELSDDRDAQPPGWRPGQDTVDAIERPQETEWVDTGFQRIPIDKIDTRDLEHVKAPEDFHKVSHDEMIEGFNKLDQVVDPAVENGADGDYFRKLDQSEGLDRENGYQRVYEAFYGDDAIRVVKDGDTYALENGAHRVTVAQETGRDTVPARVIEKRREAN